MAFIFVVEKRSKRGKKKHRFMDLGIFCHEYWRCGIVPWVHYIVSAIEPMSSSGEMEFWLQDCGSSHILKGMGPEEVLEEHSHSDLWKSWKTESEN